MKIDFTKAELEALAAVKLAEPHSDDLYSAMLKITRELVALERGDEEEPKYIGLLRDRYVPHHARILLLCQTHLRDENRKRKIVEDLRAAGIIAKSTYWKDVSFFEPLLKLLDREREGQK